MGRQQPGQNYPASLRSDFLSYISWDLIWGPRRSAISLGACPTTGNTRDGLVPLLGESLGFQGQPVSSESNGHWPNPSAGREERTTALPVSFGSFKESVYWLPVPGTFRFSGKLRKEEMTPWVFCQQPDGGGGDQD